MKTLSLFAVLVLSSCAQTVLYRDGEKIAVFQGDMTGIDFVMTHEGDVRWHAASVDHSTATKAQGESASGKIAAAGAALAASGITLLLQ